MIEWLPDDYRKLGKVYEQWLLQKSQVGKGNDCQEHKTISSLNKYLN